MRIRSSADLFASTDDMAVCRAMLRDGSRSFFAASLIMPMSVRKAATGLYAFCRLADDAIDHGTERMSALDQLHARLDQIYSGVPGIVSADRAFADSVSRFSIPRAFPTALLEGFAWDAGNRRYENLSQLKAYAVRVAGSVGTMMAMVMGVRNRDLLARACDLGVAMQLTNIARDVGEDARRARLYLPLDWLREAHIDPDDWLLHPVWSPDLAGVIKRLLATAEELYARSDGGLDKLPAACRPGMHAARLLYAEIGHEVARRGFDSINQRAVVSWQRKARILADAILAATRRTATLQNNALEEAGFLLEGLPSREQCGVAPTKSPRELVHRPSVEDRVIWLIELFERLERRERVNLR